MSTARLPRRPFGKGDVDLSIIGFGGVLVCGLEQAHAARLVAESIERGVNYFDVAPSYGDAEQVLGPALRAVVLRQDRHGLAAGRRGRLARITWVRGVHSACQWIPRETGLARSARGAAARSATLSRRTNRGNSKARP